VACRAAATVQVEAVGGVLVGLLDRVRGVFGRREVDVLDPARDDLVVVVRGFDEVEACSAALERSGTWVPAGQAVLRHHLVLPEAGRGQAAATAAQDGYAPTDRTDGSGADLVLARVQVLDALHCSQERSRMAGLAQRLGGHVLGWDALQPPAPGPSAPGR
jgi:hypothetical protein